MSRRPTSARAQQTWDKILAAALELFNRDGTSVVTTNHIAARAGISPGNLYYWFDDKNQIIRELYARLVTEFDATWATRGAVVPGPDEMLARLAGATELATAYRVVRERRTEAFGDLARSWRATGVIHPISDGDIDDLVQALWVVSEAWLPFGELGGAPVDPGLGTRLLRIVLVPYLVGPEAEGGAIDRPGGAGRPGAVAS